MKTILIADDDPDLRLALQLRLSVNHYFVVHASDGRSAIARARDSNPDLILLDLGMPAGDGFSVIDLLKANAKTASIPIVVLTGRDRRGNVNPALDGGARAFLQKPVENSRLLGVIQRELRAGFRYSF
jgi:CheY-like chemotaxis protein